jgi:hypothetical protein
VTDNPRATTVARAIDLDPGGLSMVSHLAERLQRERVQFAASRLHVSPAAATRHEVRPNNVNLFAIFVASPDMKELQADGRRIRSCVVSPGGRTRECARMAG